MFGYIVRRLISGVLVLLAVTALVFLVFYYGPTNPALAYCPEARCTPARLEVISKQLGLDQPVAKQYGVFVKGIFAGRDINTGALTQHCDAPCLGVSFKQNVNVTTYILNAFPATVSIALGAAVVFLSLGVGIGVAAARKRGQPADRMLVGTTMFATAIPYYLVALLSFIFLISQWGVFPQSGYFSPIKEGPGAWIKGMILVWIVLGVFTATAYARFSRGSMIEALNEDYVRTARAKGLTDRTVALKHALRAAVIPVVTIFGLDMAGLLAGTIFTEQIFSIDGIGRQALKSIGNQDLPVISGTVIVAAVAVVLANLAVDITYGFLDPRVRL